MNVHEINEIARAFRQCRILLTAFELDIFTYIGEHMHTSDSISGALHLDRNATERLLNALVALKLLEKTGGKFRNSGESLKYLSKDSPAYLAGIMHQNHLWNTWNHFTEVVKTGKVAHDTTINDRGGEWLEAFIHAMHDRGMKQAPAQISGIDLRNVESVLDVGGGSGCFCMAFLNRKPEMKAMVFDLPNVLPISRKIVENEGFSGRIEHTAGDYTSDELPRGFDLVFLSAIIHSNSFETNRDLVKNCYDSLNPEGRIVIQDWIMNDDRTAPPQGAIFSINMLVGVEGGDTYSEQEVRAWLQNAGFKDIAKAELESGIAQVTGVKK